MTARDAVGEIYRQVQAPDWAAPNLDGLADVLRDLSWLPPGPVPVRIPAGTGEDTAEDLAVLARLLAEIERQTAHGLHPVRVLID